MKLGWLVLAVALLAGCEAKPAPITTGSFTDDPAMVTLETYLMTDQEEIGRVIVMIARGWSDWPESYSFEGHAQPIVIETGMMKAGTQYRVTVQEIRP